MNESEFKKLPYAEYLISKEGIVWDITNNQHCKITPVSRGYRNTSIKLPNGKRISIGVHRLVAQTYIPNPENKREVNHIDGDPSNNNLANLEWVTHAENMRHSFTFLRPNRHPIYKRPNKGGKILKLSKKFKMVEPYWLYDNKIFTDCDKMRAYIDNDSYFDSVIACGVSGFIETERIIVSGYHHKKPRKPRILKK